MRWLVLGFKVVAAGACIGLVVLVLHVFSPEVQHEPGLRFSVRSCLFPVKPTETGAALETGWRGDVFFARTKVVTNCGLSPFRGGYIRDGGSLSLWYMDRFTFEGREIDMLAACLCEHQLEYAIWDIPRQEYSVSGPRERRDRPVAR